MNKKKRKRGEGGSHRWLLVQVSTHPAHSENVQLSVGSRGSRLDSRSFCGRFVSEASRRAENTEHAAPPPAHRKSVARTLPQTTTTQPCMCVKPPPSCVCVCV